MTFTLAAVAAAFVLGHLPMRTASASSNPAGIMLPWAVGQSWSANGPHLDTGTGAGVRNAVDVSGGDGHVLAAGDGTVRYGSCSGGQVLWIDHSGGWRTSYYHVTGVRVTNGQTVSRGDWIATTGTAAPCGGSAIGAQVHFSLWKDGQPYALDGLSLGGWTIHQGSDNYLGSWTRDSDGYTYTVGPDGYMACSCINNDGSGASGTIGAGTDFNGNGQDDILWYGPGNARDAIWYGSSSRSTKFVKNHSVEVKGTYKPAAGDFDGDGSTDILWYGPGSDPDSLWYGTKRAGSFAKGVSITVRGNYTPVVGDFNGNAQDDILWYGPGNARDAIWYGSSSRSTKFVKNHSVEVKGTYKPAAGDFDGDGSTDILWYGPGSDPDSLWYGTKRAGSFTKGVSITVRGNYIPVVGDFNGNAQDDILWYGPGNARDAIWYGSSSRSTKFVKNHSVEVKGTYKPAAGDFDGDGSTDILWYGPGSDPDSLWYGTKRAGSFTKGVSITVRGNYTPIQ